ncbi:MAG: hypothetical protein WDO73_29330 [Ignavibacteriota bacterium]
MTSVVKAAYVDIQPPDVTAARSTCAQSLTLESGFALSLCPFP